MILGADNGIDSIMRAHFLIHDFPSKQVFGGPHNCQMWLPGHLTQCSQNSTCPRKGGLQGDLNLGSPASASS